MFVLDDSDAGVSATSMVARSRVRTVIEAPREHNRSAPSAIATDDLPRACAASVADAIERPIAVHYVVCVVVIGLNVATEHRHPLPRAASTLAG